MAHKYLDLTGLQTFWTKIKSALNGKAGTDGDNANGTWPIGITGNAATADKSAELLSTNGGAWYTYVDNTSSGDPNQRYEIWFTGSTDGCANILVSTSVRDGAGDPWPLVFVIACEVNSSDAFTKNPKVAILYATNHSTAAKMVTVKYGTHSVGGTSYPAVFIKFADNRRHKMFISVAGVGSKIDGNRTTNTSGTDCEMEACVMTSHVGTAIGDNDTPVYVSAGGFIQAGRTIRYKANGYNYGVATGIDIRLNETGTDANTLYFS